MKAKEGEGAEAIGSGCIYLLDVYYYYILSYIWTV